MIQKDYILRMVEECTNVLAQIMGLTKGGLYTEAMLEIEKGMFGLLDVDMDLVDSLGIEGFSEYFEENLNWESPHMEVLGDLLKTQAEIQAAQGNQSKSQVLFQKALRAFEKADQLNTNMLSMGLLEKIRSVKHQIQ